MEKPTCENCGKECDEGYKMNVNIYGENEEHDASILFTPELLGNFTGGAIVAFDNMGRRVNFGYAAPCCTRCIKKYEKTPGHMPLG